MNLSRKNVVIDETSLSSMRLLLQQEGIDFVIAGQMLTRWSNGNIKKHIVFEHKNNTLTALHSSPPIEPAPYSKERWNPFLSYVLAREDVYQNIPSTIKNDPKKLLQYALTNQLKVKILPDIIAYEQNKLTLIDLVSPKSLITKSQPIRDTIVRLNILKNNLWVLISEKKAYEDHLKKIAKIIENKEIVVKISFGGIGDCLAFSSLPRLLKEEYGVDFYLDSETKDVFRNEDIKKLCFDLNPFFKGFKSTNDPFIFKKFQRNRSLTSILSDRGGNSAVAELEKQFNLTTGKGVPEIFYNPKFLPGYENTMLCDDNWFSGEKWGLYNDPEILKKIVSDWQKSNPENKTEYCSTDKQDIFSYVDKIYSAAKFITFYSGGNSIAAAINKKAIVIVPENLDGESVSLFLFKKSSVTYTRKRSLAGYF
jgi:ribosomal protein L30/L7E